MRFGAVHTCAIRRTCPRKLRKSHEQQRATDWPYKKLELRPSAPGARFPAQLYKALNLHTFGRAARVGTRLAIRRSRPTKGLPRETEQKQECAMTALRKIIIEEEPVVASETLPTRA